MTRMLVVAAVALCASAAVLPRHAVAQTPDDWQLSDSWRFGAAVYAWLPGVRLKATLPPSGPISDTSISFNKILDHLMMGLAGGLEAQKGRWGAFTDVMYMRLGDTPSKTRDFSLGNAPLSADVSAAVTVDEIKAAIWTLAGSYRGVASPEAVLDVLTGAHMLDVSVNQSWQLTGNIGPIPLPGRSGSGEVSSTRWDAIIGVRGRFALSADRRWFAPYHLDVGTGNSRLTWQALGGHRLCVQLGRRHRHLALPGLQQQVGPDHPAPEHERAQYRVRIPLVACRRRLHKLAESPAAMWVRPVLIAPSIAAYRRISWRH